MLLKYLRIGPERTIGPVTLRSYRPSAIGKVNLNYTNLAMPIGPVINGNTNYPVGYRLSGLLSSEIIQMHVILTKLAEL